MNLEYTLCKKCEKCVELIYTNTTRDGTKFKFKYCKENLNLIKKFRFGIIYKDRLKKLNPEIVIRSSFKDGANKKFRNRKLRNVLKKESKKPRLNYLNDNPFDLRLKNLTTAKSKIYLEKVIKTVPNSDEISENPVSKEKTMCKNCDICKTYIYDRQTKQKEFVWFKFCEGNKETLMDYEYFIHKDTNGEEYVAIASEKSEIGSYSKEAGIVATSLFKNNKNNPTDYVNGDQKDLSLKNLREITMRCLTQKDRGDSTDFPGVKKYFNYYQSSTYIDGMWKNLGKYETAMDAYHAHVLKHKELGIKLNTETRAHKKYLNEYDPTNFKRIKYEKISRFKGVSIRNDKFEAYYRTKKRIAIGRFKTEIEAFHAYVLWCEENNKEVDTSDEEYQDFLKKTKPSNNLKEYIQSKKRKPTSRYPNVFFHKRDQKWIGQILKKKKTVFYKSFDNEYDAHVAVEKARLELKKN